MDSIQQNSIFSALAPRYSRSEITALMRIIEDAMGLAPLTLTLRDDKSSNLSAEERSKLQDIVERLSVGEPIQHILGEAYFYGFPFRVSPDVLIPRPETEELVEWILSTYTLPDQPLRILDIGTGSGCIAITLAKKLPQSKVWAMDISPEALQMAQTNADRLGADVVCCHHDIFEPFCPPTSFDVIVSNPPYITTDEQADMDDTVLNYEPHLALFVPNSDAIRYYLRIAHVAWETLNNGGRLFFEINRSKGEEIVEMLNHMGFVEVQLRRDISGNNRMISAQKPQ